MVQDPNFWRRFSVAVHQDDLEKEQVPGNLKHSYVSSNPSTAPMSPTSQCHLSPAFPASPIASISMSLSPPTQPTLRQEEIWQAEFEAEKAEEREREREREQEREREAQRNQNPIRKPSKLKKSASRASTRPLLRNQSQTKHAHKPSFPDLERPPSLRRPDLSGLRSPSALSLSGRPRTLFKTWTTITANPVCRDSWLASQKKKSRQRTWICWCFWLCVLALVAGVVVAVLVLKAHDII
jgi:hypothetical protein